jgi:hypothetical protein
VIHGDSPDARLTLDGIFISGQDVVLQGTFSSVTLTCCTLDPGSAAAGDDLIGDTSPPLELFQIAVDGRHLRPTRLWIEAEVASLVVDRCVLGPIRTRAGGIVENASISNSVMQAIRSSDVGLIERDDVKDPRRLIRLLQLGVDPVSALLRALDPGIETLLGPPASPPLSDPILPDDTIVPLLVQLNELIAGPSLYQAAAFAGTPLSTATRRLLTQATPMQPAPTLNRLLLEDAYPLELADASLAFADGDLNLSRCTLLGRLVAHRLEASECILQDLAEVDDLQGGCVRFSAWAQGSKVPRQYESVVIPQAAPLFTDTNFGQPAYAQLLLDADFQIEQTPSKAKMAPRNTISSGAADGSEMGAYARDKNPIRAHALLLKLQEYMPANLVPVIVEVT